MKFFRSSTNPQNKEDMLLAKTFLGNVARFCEVDPDPYVLQLVNNKKVLDVGCVEHDENYFLREGWKHKKISMSAEYCLGIDIAPSNMICRLSDLGYNVRGCDATSDVDLEDRFDLINVGDVIEHVNNPVDLLKFCKRHLKDTESKIVVTTPNPWFYRFVLHTFTGKTYIANLDHVCWITPVNMLELCSRSGLELKEVVWFVPERLGRIKRILRRMFPELFSMTGEFKDEVQHGSEIHETPGTAS